MAQVSRCPSHGGRRLSFPNIPCSMRRPVPNLSHPGERGDDDGKSSKENMFLPMDMFIGNISNEAIWIRGRKSPWQPPHQDWTNNILASITHLERNLQITHLERKMIFQTSMIMFHVNLQGCTSSCGFSTSRTWSQLWWVPCAFTWRRMPLISTVRSTTPILSRGFFFWVMSSSLKRWKVHRFD